MRQIAPIAMKYRSSQAGFATGWYAVAESRAILHDTLKPVAYLGRQMIVFRNRSGAAQVADAYCPHLGAHLASHDGRVENGTIVCPFHKWNWDGESGRCVHIPYASSLPPGGVRLTLYPTREVDGAILVWYHPSGGEPSFEPYAAPELAQDEWELFDVKTWITRCPFQDILENTFDSAHIVQLHRAVAVPAMTRKEPRPYGMFVEYALNPNSEGPQVALKLDFTGITLLHQRYEGGGLPGLYVIALTPLDEEQVEQKTWFYLKKAEFSDPERKAAEAFVDIFAHEVEQDFKVLDFKKHLLQPRLCRGDGPIYQYREYARQYYCE